MNRYLKIFLHRGLIFGGFGPIILGIVYAILEKTVDAFSLNGVQILIAIVSIYLLAFVQAGATVFEQIEHWGTGKSLFCHLGVLYLAYVGCYLLNNWIPFEPTVIMIFTGIFVVGYLLIWAIIVLATKGISRKLNEKIASK